MMMIVLYADDDDNKCILHSSAIHDATNFDLCLLAKRKSNQEIAFDIGQAVSADFADDKTGLTYKPLSFQLSNQRQTLHLPG